MVSNNDHLLAKFHSGTLKITDTMRLMSLFGNITRIFPLELAELQHKGVLTDFLSASIARPNLSASFGGYF